MQGYEQGDEHCILFLLPIRSRWDMGQTAGVKTTIIGKW